MARSLARSLADIRRLLLALLAVALVLRMGAGCEAMAAMPAPPLQPSHCADMPTEPGQPSGAAATDCALCVALPDAAIPLSHSAAYARVEPARASPARLAGLAGGPAPPPPRIA